MQHTEERKKAVFSIFTFSPLFLFLMYNKTLRALRNNSIQGDGKSSTDCVKNLCADGDVIGMLEMIKQFIGN